MICDTAVDDRRRRRVTASLWATCVVRATAMYLYMCNRLSVTVFYSKDNRQRVADMSGIGSSRAPTPRLIPGIPCSNNGKEDSRIFFREGSTDELLGVRSRLRLGTVIVG
jgi:hypothetical protein